MTEFTEDDRVRLRAIHQDEQRTALLQDRAPHADATSTLDDHKKFDDAAPGNDWRKVHEARRNKQNTLIITLTGIGFLIIAIWLVVVVGPIVPGP